MTEHADPFVSVGAADVTDAALTPGQVRTLTRDVAAILDLIRNDVLKELRKLNTRIGELEHEQAAIVARMNAADAHTERRLARLEARVDALVPVTRAPRTSRK